MKTGLFFGTYNPIHVGHMVIANFMVEFTDLDQIHIVVTPLNPFKEDRFILPEQQRIEFVKMAIGDDGRLLASDVEFSLPQPNYTVNTLEHLRKRHPDDEFILVMGADNLSDFHRWKDYGEILNHHHIYVYPRMDAEIPEGFRNHPKVSYYEAPIMRISSSFIREAISAGKNVRHYLPDGIHDYIREMQFYEKV